MSAVDPRPAGRSVDAVEPDEDGRSIESLSALAEEFRIPIDEVKRAYEKHYSRLKSDASVGQYLALLAARHTRDEFRQRSARAPAQGTGEAA